MILSALVVSSTFKVKRYLGVRSLNLVTELFLFFLIVIFSALGRCFLSLRIILMNSFKSLISLGYTTVSLGAETYHWDEPLNKKIPTPPSM